MTSHPKGPLRLLHVHAHPDDESSKGAATTAKYVAEGVEVMVVTGRSKTSAMPVVSDLALAAPTVLFNGCAVWCQREARASRGALAPGRRPAGSRQLTGAGRISVQPAAAAGNAPFL